VRVHGAGEHALELEALDLALELAGVALDLGDGAGVGLALGELEQLERAGDAAPDPIEALGDRGELRALAAEGLGAVGAVPDLGIFEFPAYLGEPLALAVVLKDTPLRRRGVPRDPSAGGGWG
jgi:hypothetical protein